MIIQTKLGPVEGFQDKHLSTFLSIPYAKGKRFEPSVLYQHDDLIQATSFSHKSMQISNNEIIGDEDCLNLNIWTPNLDGKLPVLVYIHGGAFQTGSGQSVKPFEVIQDDNFIFVSINYRTGALGYLVVPGYEYSGNIGTLDQLNALKWINENIECFGGDPTRVTLIGDSAGGKSIGALMLIGKQYFQQVILISGAYQAVRDKHSALYMTKRFEEYLGDDFKNIATLPASRILEAQKEVCKGNSTDRFGPIADGLVIPENYYELIHTDAYFTGKAFLSSNLHELNFAKFIPNYLDTCEATAYELFGDQGKFAIAKAKEYGNTVEGWVKVFSDYMYRLYTYRMAKLLSKHNDVYIYSFNYGAALHCFNYYFAHGKEDHCTPFYNEQEMEHGLELGKWIRDKEVEFITTGHIASLKTAKDGIIYNLGETIEEAPLNEFEDETYPDQVYKID